MIRFNYTSVEDDIQIIHALLNKAKEENGRRLSKSEARDVNDALKRIRDVVVSDRDKSGKNLKDVIMKKAPKVAYTLWKLVEMFNE